MAFFSILERIRPAGPHKKLRGAFLNLEIAALFYFASSLAGAAGAYLATAATRFFGEGLIDLRFVNTGKTATIIASFVISMFIFDFFYYWRHRLQHQSEILWETHKLHHMDREMSATTRGRGDWSEPFVSMFLMTVPMAVLFKLDPGTTGKIGAALSFALQMLPIFFHSNIKLRFGWATVLITGPQLHRIHHSRLPHHHNKNFAAYFPIWDVIFGTYYQPAREEFPPTGIHDEADSETLWEATTVQIRGWWMIFSRWRKAAPEQAGGQL